MFTKSYGGLAHQPSRMHFLSSLQSSVCEEESIIDLMLLEIKCHGLFSGRKKKTHLAPSVSVRARVWEWYDLNYIQ